MTNLDEQIDNILLKGIELGSDEGQPYIRYTEAAVDDLVALIAQQVKEARIEELQHIREFWGQAKDESLSSKPFNFVALSDIDNRIKELQEGKK